jgi:type IV pilus assembly protein PilB
MNRLVVLSVQRGASDIHIEPHERYFRVRFRIDGVLEEIVRLPNTQRDPLLQRIKIMARLDIAERRLPQGGRFKRKLHLEGRSRELDYRVSVLPTLRGEKAVLRLLDKSKLMLDMRKLGFEPASLERWERHWRTRIAEELGDEATVARLEREANQPEVAAPDYDESRLPGHTGTLARRAS